MNGLLRAARSGWRPAWTGRRCFASKPLEVFSETLDAAKLVKDLSDAHPVFVISKQKCPFCRRAKALLSDLEAEFTVHELDSLSEQAKAVLQAYMKATTGAGSVPRIFIQGHCEGGFSEVQRKLWAGQLVPSLLAAGALSESSPAAKGGSMFFEAGNPML
mmetsp:Transcript_43007/g.100177  ORF Transcript_43007/g.100177 Transcript_43007/m.100177 type:complete len:160 (+) Transcript_43007:20-499(+)